MPASEADDVVAEHGRAGKAACEKADGYSGRPCHAFLKRQKRRKERHKAKRNPECLATYGRYKGWES